MIFTPFVTAFFNCAGMSPLASIANGLTPEDDIGMVGVNTSAMLSAEGAPFARENEPPHESMCVLLLAIANLLVADLLIRSVRFSVGTGVSPTVKLKLSELG